MPKKKAKKSPFLTILGTIVAVVILLYQYITGDIVIEFEPSPVQTSGSAPAQNTTAAPAQTAEAEVQEGMTLHVLEVGKADCLLLECDGQYMLVDGGNEEDEEYILKKLGEMGVEKLDVLVNTHPHEDHLGSLDAVVNALDVEKAYISPREHTTANYERLLIALAEKNVQTEIPTPGDSWQLGGATVTVLSPAHDADYDGYNDWSLVLLCEYGEVRYLLMGDAETPVEGDLVDSGIDLSADVLKIGHHGSATSSRKSFLAAVSPSYALITCDGTEEAGAPHDKVVRYLEEYSIPYLRTDENGVISVYTDGRDLALTTERETVIR